MRFLRKFTRRDLGFSVLTGLIAGSIAWRVLLYLRVPEIQSFPWAGLIVIIPILWIAGVMLGYLLGQRLKFFDQFGKFAAIGFTNFSVNAGVLNVLLASTGYTRGRGYSLINSIAFIVSLLSSYIWNKYWAFKSDKNFQARGEFVKFFIVTLIAFGVSITVASVVVNYIHPALGLNPHQWANIAAVIGSAIGLVFSFVGFRLAVFR